MTEPIALTDDEILALWTAVSQTLGNHERARALRVGRAIADRALNATAQGMWQPIETAPMDGTPILGWCQHTADAYYDGDRLTAYGARAEGLSHVEDGPHVLIWGESYEVSDGWENPSFMMPAGWELSHDCEVMANPTHWMPLPAAPTAAIQAVDAVAGEPVGVVDDAKRVNFLEGEYWSVRAGTQPDQWLWNVEFFTTGGSHKTVRDAIDARLSEEPTIAQPVDERARLVSMVLDDMDTCCGELGADYEFKELSSETIEAIKAYRAKGSK